MRDVLYKHKEKRGVWALREEDDVLQWGLCLATPSENWGVSDLRSLSAFSRSSWDSWFVICCCCFFFFFYDDDDDDDDDVGVGVG